ncbi:Pdx1p [Sporobolomyces koalae]|uniref:Pdx1p n=1 Tax=Sporobolomyces koalae TaxID=500713 RepID=UPI003173B1D7
MLVALRNARQAARPLARQLHQSRMNAAITEFRLPAMSPTMTEGSIGEWKFKEGEAFSASDVLMTVETDKATVDVEAQDDGILAKIGVAAGTAGIPVGQIIALLAEEGDDISNLEFPPPGSLESSAADAAAPVVAESDAPTPSPMTPATHVSAIHAHPTHPRPLLPSVLRQLALAGITDTKEIKATGYKGMLTKGDVLAFLGKIGNPHGSIKKENLHQKHPALEYAASPKDTKPQVQIQLDGPTIRRLIATGLGLPAISAAAPAVSTQVPAISFDSILDDYLPAPLKTSSAAAQEVPLNAQPAAPRNDFDALLDF